MSQTGLCQDGDAELPHFSYMWDQIGAGENELFTLNPWADSKFHVEQMPCWVTYTNPSTHEIIASNIDKSPMYCGVIEGTGPRYCPSIEDKVMRFADKDRHQVFLEPEGRHTHEYYINGVSTSLPYEVQFDFIRSIEGLENAEIIRPGYAVEYDYCPPTQLSATLETKRIEGLYFAGQINGTSGYEEAAGQGLIAGTNAALKAAGKQPFILGRDQAYLGVMVDDLVTKGCTEPYRMFTSRAEYRLLLRQDNADQRLTPLASEIGLVSGDRAERAAKKIADLQQASVEVPKISHDGIKLDHWFRRAENLWSDLPEELQKMFPVELWPLIETDFKYAGHIARQQMQIDRMASKESKVIPSWVDFEVITGLKREARIRFTEHAPRTLGQASRLPGITPADVSMLSIWIEKHDRREKAADM